MGASPEILVRHRGSEILSYALAGTAPKHGPNAWTKEQLLTDKKNLFEHNIVRDRIVHTMKAITPEVTIGETGIMELAHLYHCGPSLLQRIVQVPRRVGTIVTSYTCSRRGTSRKGIGTATNVRNP